jgi:hypothetical protein
MHDEKAPPAARVAAASALLTAALANQLSQSRRLCRKSIQARFVAAILHYANISLPLLHTHYFALLLLAYLVLVAGNVVEGI